MFLGEAPWASSDALRLLARPSPLNYSPSGGCMLRRGAVGSRAPGRTILDPCLNLPLSKRYQGQQDLLRHNHPSRNSEKFSGSQLLQHSATLRHVRGKYQAAEESSPLLSL